MRRETNLTDYFARQYVHYNISYLAVVRLYNICGYYKKVVKGGERNQLIREGRK